MSSTRGAALVLALALAGCATHGPVIDRAPPPERADVQGTKPGSGCFWVAGHWTWSKDTKDYFWTPGRWERTRDGWILLPGAWTKVEGGWEWSDERWEKTR